jgi:site-specific recombinase XerD
MLLPHCWLSPCISSARHTFATDLYRETTNIRLTHEALGHANLATTQIYTHVVDEELEGALKSFRHEGAALRRGKP